MYLVTCYNYNIKTNNELAVGSKRNMESFIEEYCYEYINSLQGKRIDNLLIKKNFNDSMACKTDMMLLHTFRSLRSKRLKI